MQGNTHIYGRGAKVAGFLLACFFADLAFLQGVDMYREHFSQSGAIVALYNLARLFLIPSLLWLCYAVGWSALSRITREPPAPAARVLLGFFTGAALWHMAFFPLGLLGLYRLPFVLLITSAVMLISFPQLVSAVGEAGAAWREWRGKANRQERFAAIALAVVAILFLYMRAIYPGGGHDYFTHYFYYDAAVAERGTTAPNEIWYHFFYSKGSALYYIAMLMSDPLAPPLVSACFMLSAALILALLAKRWAPGTLLPYVAPLLYLGLQLYIRGMGFGTWGHLQKLHEIIAVMTLALLWCCLMLPEQANKRPWLITMLLITVSSVIVSFAAAFIFIGLMGASMLVYGWRKKRALALYAMGIAAAGVLTMLAMMWLNYIYTGIPDDHFILSLWPLLSWEKIKQWGVLFELLVQYYGREGMLAGQLPLGDVPRAFVRFLRFEMLYPLYAAALLYAGWLKYQGRRVAASPHADWHYIAALFAVFIVLALYAGRIETISFYRFSSFMFAPVIALGVLLMSWTGAAKQARIVLAVALCCFLTVYPRQWKDSAASFANAVKFAAGSYSIDEAYMHQRGLPSDAPYPGAIHPAAREAYTIAGEGTRIWSMHTYTYCMLPRCNLQTFISFRLSAHMSTVLAGTPAEAKRILQQEGLNYFLISPDIEIKDPLPLSPLFSPDQIAKNLAVRWTDGDSALLTWPDRDTKPIPAAWLKRYKQAVADSPTVQHFPREQIVRYLKEADAYRGRTLPKIY